MKLFYSILIFLSLFADVAGQNKKKVFTLPENISYNDYKPGEVLVKIKSDYRPLFENSQAGSRMSNANISVVKPLVPKELANKAHARQAPRKSSISNVDLSLYYQLSFDPQSDIETVINQLYATGYFEIVEPSYRYHQFHDPNDPARTSQYYLDKINAFEAWDISKSNASVVIAIIDSGGDLDHPDIASKLFINENEIPGNGVDDDGNTFIDDVNGWDFSGAQEALIGTPGFNGDNNPAITKGGTHTHGTEVAGCAAAATNNSTGIAGVGYNARLLFTKHFADDQPEDDTFYSSNLYLGILYAAEVLADNNIDMKIINCSFGGSGKSQVIQDLLDFVTLDYNSLIVAAAGNGSSEAFSYPAAYNNVLSVASTDSGDRKSSFSNFGTWVDISAPGSAIFTTTYDNDYGSTQGTSFSSPITAGAAALVWADDPTLTPVQVAEKLRVSADESFYELNTATFDYKLGKGRLDVFLALTTDFPSLRASKIRVQNEDGSSAVRPSQTGLLYFDVFNHLTSTSPNVEISVSSSSSLVTFTTGEIFPGVIGEGNKISLKQNPFIFTTAASISPNTPINFIVSYNDGNYHDYEVISVNLNPSYIDLEENQVSTTVSSIGRVGYDGDGQTRGLGFQFNGTPLLYEMGLIMGSSSATILNNVRGASTGPYDQDFVDLEQIDQIIPGERSATEIFGKISNSATPASQQIQVEYRSMIWRDAPNDQFVILEYKLSNPTATTITGYHLGLFADWDISSGDGANWNPSLKLGYIFPKADVSLPLSGIQLLTGTGNHYAIDNNQDLAGNPFGLYDGYADSEKFTSISTSRDEAGVAAEGGDVSHVISSGPLTINAGQTVTIAFALHAASDLVSLLESADAANTLYNLTLQAPTPVVVAVEACYGSGANISATGATNFNWYHEFTDGEPFFSGNQLVTGALYNDTTFYVSNADNSYESVRTPAVVTLKANPHVIISGPTTFCEGGSVTLSGLEADEYEWSTGAVTQSIEVSTAGTYSLIVRDLGLACDAESIPIVVTVNPLPVADFSSEAESITNTPVIFTDESTGAVSWHWDFGDGATSTQQNPTHQYDEGGDYQITLTVTSASGCQDDFTNGIDIITSTEKELESAISVYPNPARENIIVNVSGLSSPGFTIQLMNVQGQVVYGTFDLAENGTMSHTIPTVALPKGMYFLKISNERNTVIRKVAKVD